MQDELRDVDLNLLLVLDTLLETRSVTRTAERLGMTQSGASRALGRLREQFVDPLFVLEAGALSPTPHCESLGDELQRCLSAARSIVSARAFEPATAEGTVTLGMPDHLALRYGTPILSALQAEAPKLGLAIQSFTRDWVRDLRSGVVDMAFGVLAGDEASLRSRKVLDDPWVVVLRRGHPALHKRWTAAAFAAGEHGLMYVPGSGRSQVDRALAERGLSRRVVFRASSPIVVALAAATSDLRVTTTASLAHLLAEHHPLVVRKLPVAAEPLRLPLAWHERLHHDARHRFVRRVVADTLTDIS